MQLLEAGNDSNGGHFPPQMCKILRGTGPFQHGKLCPPGVDLQLQHLERTRLLLLEAKFIKFLGILEGVAWFFSQRWNMMSCLFFTGGLCLNALHICTYFANSAVICAMKQY